MEEGFLLQGLPADRQLPEDVRVVDGIGRREQEGQIREGKEGSLERKNPV